MQYNLYDLMVVSYQKHKFICLYNENADGFIEVLTKTMIKSDEVDSITQLSSYKDKYDNTISLKDILLMYIEINERAIDNKKLNIDDLLKFQERKIEEFEKLKISNPKLAKIIALQDLENAGILDNEGNLKEPYNKIFVKTDKK